MIRFFLGLLNSLLGGATGMIYRPFQHLLLTAGLYALTMLTIPFKIFSFMHALTGFDLFHRRPGSYTVAAVLTLTVTPAVWALTTAAATVAVLGSVFVSPFIGLFVGLVYGLQGTFASTWLSKGLWELTTDIFASFLPASDPFQRALNEHHARVVYNDMQHDVVREAPDRGALFDRDIENQFDAEPEIAAPHNPVQDEEAEFNRQMAEALRISFEYNRDQASLSSIARRAVNMYRQPSPEAVYANSLVTQLNQLTENNLDAIPYLTQEEMEILQTSEAKSVKADLQKYKEILDRSCIYSLEDMRDIPNLITIKFAEANSARHHTYVVNKDDLVSHFNRSALDNVIPELTQARPNRLEGVAISADHSVMTGMNVLGGHITICRGIDIDTHTELNQLINTMRNAIASQNQPSASAPSQEGSSTARLNQVISLKAKNDNAPQFPVAQPVISQPILSAAEIRRQQTLAAIEKRNNQTATATTGVANRPA